MHLEMGTALEIDLQRQISIVWLQNVPKLLAFGKLKTVSKENKDNLSGHANDSNVPVEEQHPGSKTEVL